MVFLSSRRSAWNYALHSFHTALGKIDAPFFGVSQKQKRERGGKGTPFFAVSSIGLVGWCVGCAVTAFDAAEAGAGAAEVVKGAVVLPTPGTEAWWRAAVGEAVYAMREVQYVWETVDWTGLLKKLGGLQLLQRLDPPFTLPVESKASCKSLGTS